MPTYSEYLRLARDQIAANLAMITAEPKPNYSIDGQTVSWQSLLESYTTELAKLDALLAAGEPFEIQSQGCTGP